MSICCVNAVLNFSGRVSFVSVHGPVLDPISVGSFLDPFSKTWILLDPTLFGSFLDPTRPDPFWILLDPFPDPFWIRFGSVLDPTPRRRNGVEPGTGIEKTITLMRENQATQNF